MRKPLSRSQRRDDNLSKVYYLKGDETLAQEHLEQAVALLAEIGADSSGPVAEMWQSGTW